MFQIHLLDAEEGSFKTPGDTAMISIPTRTGHLSVAATDCSGNSSLI